MDAAQGSRDRKGPLRGNMVSPQKAGCAEVRGSSPLGSTISFKETG